MKIKLIFILLILFISCRSHKDTVITETTEKQTETQTLTARAESYTAAHTRTDSSAQTDSTTETVIVITEFDTDKPNTPLSKRTEITQRKKSKIVATITEKTESEATEKRNEKINLKVDTNVKQTVKEKKSEPVKNTLIAIVAIIIIVGLIFVFIRFYPFLRIILQGLFKSIFK